MTQTELLAAIQSSGQTPAAVDVAEQIAEELELRMLECTSLQVSPTNLGLIFEWRRDQRYASIEVLHDGSVNAFVNSPDFDAPYSWNIDGLKGFAGVELNMSLGETVEHIRHVIWAHFGN